MHKKKSILYFLVFCTPLMFYASENINRKKVVLFDSEDSQESSTNKYYYTQDSESDYSSSEEQKSSGFGDILIVPRHSSSHEEFHEDKIVFSTFYYTLAETKEADDIHTDTICIRAPLFAQLCVQALKTLHDSTLSQGPFQELLQRLNKGIIAKKYNTQAMQEQYLMTKKDLKHRLLSYIPQGKKKCLVNDKIVTFHFRTYQTDRDLIEWDKITKDKQTEYGDDYLEELMFCTVPTSGKELVACAHDFESNKEHRLNIVYDFKSDKKHHLNIVKEFELLLKK